MPKSNEVEIRISHLFVDTEDLTSGSPPPGPSVTRFSSSVVCFWSFVKVLSWSLKTTDPLSKQGHLLFQIKTQIIPETDLSLWYSFCVVLKFGWDIVHKKKQLFVAFHSEINSGIKLKSLLSVWYSCSHVSNGYLYFTISYFPYGSSEIKLRRALHSTYISMT